MGVWALVAKVATGLKAGATGQKISMLSKVGRAAQTVGKVAKVGKEIKDFSGKFGGEGGSSENAKYIGIRRIDTGFYGHDKVPGHKQDKSGWSKL